MVVPFRRALEPRMQQMFLVALLAFAVLWRGGKSLDATWILTGVAAFLTITSWWQHRDHPGSSPSQAQDITGQGVPRSLWITVMSFVVVTVLSYFFSSTRNYGLDEVLQTASLALIFFWTVRSNDQLPMINDQFTRAIMFLTLGSCVIGVFVYVLQPVDRFVGTFFDYRFHTDYWPNAFAEFLLLSWPICLLHFAQSSKLKASNLFLGFILGCLLLTYSRGAFIAFGGQLILLGILVAWRCHTEEPERQRGRLEVLRAFGALCFGQSSPRLRPAGRLSMTRMLIVALAALLTFFAVNALRSPFFTVQSVEEKATFTAAEGVSSISERQQFFTQAALLALEKPLLGFGPYSFRFLQPKLQTGVMQTSDHPHNVFLKLSLERGVVAAVLFAIIVGYVLFTNIRTLFVTRYSFLDQSQKLSVVSRQLFVTSLAGVVAHNLIDYNLQFVGIALPFWVLMGSLVPPAVTIEASPKARNRRCWELVLVAVLLLVSVREGAYLATSSLGRSAEQRGDTEAALRWYSRSRGEWFSRDLLLSEGRLLLFEKGDVTGAEQTFSRYLTVNDEDSRAHRLFGDALRKQGNLRRAEREYSRAYDLGRWNDLSPVSALLSLYLQEGNTKAIDDWKGELLNLLRAYRIAIAENTHYIALGPNVEALLDIYQILRGLYAEDEATIAMWMEEVKAEAEEERSRLRSRSPGWLW